MENQTKITNKAFYRVNLIRSERACLREGYEPKTIDSHVGDFKTKNKAMQVYEKTETGSELEKQLIFIDESKGVHKEIETTY